MFDYSKEDHERELKAMEREIKELEIELKEAYDEIKRLERDMYRKDGWD